MAKKTNTRYHPKDAELLTRKQRVVLDLRNEGYTLLECARILGLGISNVQHLQERALRTLKDYR